MFTNIGGKIKKLTVFMMILNIISSIILGIYLIYLQGITGVLVLVFGPIFSWISSFILYGFGELIELTDEIADYTLELQEKNNKIVRLNEEEIEQVFVKYLKRAITENKENEIEKINK